MKFMLPLFLFILLLSSCANMVAPIGGEKDISSPVLLSINSEVKKKHQNQKIISFTFDEFIVLNNWEENFYISPPIKRKIQKKIKGKELFLTIEDTLTEKATYNLVLNSSIKDLNEGNILETLNYTFPTSEVPDTFSLNGKLQDAYTLESIGNAWVMLFTENNLTPATFTSN